MVLVNFDTGNPLVPGDLVHDDSKPTEEHVHFSSIQPRSEGTVTDDNTRPCNMQDRVL